MGCMWWNWIFCCLTVRTSSRLSFLFKKLSTYIEAFKSSWWKAILRAWAHSLFEIRVNKNEKQNWVMPSSILDVCVCVCVCVSCSVVSDSLLPHGLYSAVRLLCPWNSPRKNIETGSHSFLPGNLPVPGIEPTFSALSGRIFYHLSHQGSSVSLIQYLNEFLIHS